MKKLNLVKEELDSQLSLLNEEISGVWAKTVIIEEQAKSKPLSEESKNLLSQLKSREEYLRFYIDLYMNLDEQLDAWSVVASKYSLLDFSNKCTDSELETVKLALE